MFLWGVRTESALLLCVPSAAEWGSNSPDDLVPKGLTLPRIPTTSILFLVFSHPKCQLVIKPWDTLKRTLYLQSRDLHSGFGLLVWASLPFFGFHRPNAVEGLRGHWKILLSQDLWFCFSRAAETVHWWLTMDKCAVPEAADIKLLFCLSAMTDSLTSSSSHRSQT